MDYYQQLLIICPLIFLSGFIDSIAGGGGLISLPTYHIAGFSAHFALGTNKFASSIGTIFSTMRFVKNKNYNLTSAIPSILFALIGAAIGAKIAVYLDVVVLRYVLIFSIPVIAGIVYKKKNLERRTTKNLSKVKIVVYSSVIGLVIGGYDGFFGPGTGTFLILIYTSVLGFDLLTCGVYRRRENPLYDWNTGCFLRHRRALYRQRICHQKGANDCSPHVACCPRIVVSQVNLRLVCYLNLFT